METIRRSARLSSSATTSPAPKTQSPAARVAKTASKPASRKRKGVAAQGKTDVEAPPRPSTPPLKKRRGRPAAGPSPVPVPASAAPPPATPQTPRAKHPAVRRLANPDATNAPLLSPETSRVISVHPLRGLDTPPAGQNVVTTTNILEEACAHLVRVDPKLKPLIEAKYCHVFSPDSLAEQVDPFEALASGIISQQVSGAAARAIKGRFIELFKMGTTQKFPHPSQVAVMGIDKLRTAGLSQRKAEYLQGLAEKFVSGELSAQLLAEASYETLVERLVSVRGLGLWSVEMFAIFGLKRMDVFSVGDLGVQRGMAAFAGRDIAKLKRAGSTTSKKNAKWKYMAEQDMVAMAEPFRPYRSVFMWYMWQVESVDVSSMG